MSNNMTTTLKGFRVEDITFHNARRQCEIDNEIDKTEDEESVVKAPISLTPEQVKDFYKSKIALAKDSNEKRVYSQTINWIDELSEVKKKLFLLEYKEVVANEGTDTDDLVEEQ